jgi:acetoin utilization protein AcuB
VDLERLEHMPTVKLAMTPFPWCVEASAPIAEARAMLATHEIHHLPVTENGSLVGVLSDREIALAAAGAAVRDVAVLHAYVVEDTTPLASVVAHMAEARIGAAIVVRRGKLVGVFTVTDACRVLAAWLRARFPGPPPPERVA